MLVDDHPVVRQGLSALLKNQPDMEVVEEADNGLTAVVLAQETQPDVVVMDVSMPRLNGAEATRQICQTVPSAKVLILSSYCDVELVEHLLQAGAAGYVTKDSAAELLAAAIRAVHRGNGFFSPGISRRLRHRQFEPARREKPAGLRPELTSRQVEVLQLIAEGLGTKQIAAKLGLSQKTVGKHRQSLMKRLDVHEIAGLTRYAISRGLVQCTEAVRCLQAPLPGAQLVTSAGLPTGPSQAEWLCAGNPHEQ